MTHDGRARRDAGLARGAEGRDPGADPGRVDGALRHARLRGHQHLGDRRARGDQPRRGVLALRQQGGAVQGGVQALLHPVLARGRAQPRVARPARARARALRHVRGVRHAATARRSRRWCAGCSSRRPCASRCAASCSRCTRCSPTTCAQAITELSGDPREADVATTALSSILAGNLLFGVIDPGLAQDSGRRDSLRASPSACCSRSRTRASASGTHERGAAGGERGGARRARADRELPGRAVRAVARAAHPPAGDLRLRAAGRRARRQRARAIGSRCSTGSRPTSTAPSPATAQHPLLQRLTPTLQALALPRAPFAALIEANRRDQRISRYPTWRALAEYCEFSANPVGELVLHVFGAPTPERFALSDQVCTALQLVEHCQDVAEDFARGRVYLPAEDLVRFGAREADLAATSASPALRAVLRFEVERARGLLASGSALVRTLSGRGRLAVAGFIAGGRAALDALERADFDVLAARPSRAGAISRAGSSERGCERACAAHRGRRRRARRAWPRRSPAPTRAARVVALRGAPAARRRDLVDRAAGPLGRQRPARVPALLHVLPRSSSSGSASRDRVVLQPRLAIPVLAPGGRTSWLRRARAARAAHLAREPARASRRSRSASALRSGRTALRLKSRRPRRPRSSTTLTFGEWLRAHGESDARDRRLLGPGRAADPEPARARGLARARREGVPDGPPRRARRRRRRLRRGAAPARCTPIRPSARSRRSARRCAKRARVQRDRARGERRRAARSGSTASARAFDAVVLAAPHDGRREAPARAGRARPGGARGARHLADREPARRLRPARASRTRSAPAVGSPLAVDLRPHARARGSSAASTSRCRSRRADRWIGASTDALRAIFVPAFRRLLPAARDAVLERFFATCEPAATFRAGAGHARACARAPSTRVPEPVPRRRLDRHRLARDDGRRGAQRPRRGARRARRRRPHPCTPAGDRGMSDAVRTMTPPVDDALAQARARARARLRAPARDARTRAASGRASSRPT